MLTRQLSWLTYFLGFYLLLQGTAYGRSATILTWNDDSVNEQGFFVERTDSDDCVGGWEVIAYTGIDQNFLMDVFIPGACYRVAAYNEIGASTYSDPVRVPTEAPVLCCTHVFGHRAVDSAWNLAR